MEVDDEVIAFGAQLSGERDIVKKAGHTTASSSDDNLVEVRVVGDDGSCGRLDDIGEVGVGEALSQSADGRRREDDVADLA